MEKIYLIFLLIAMSACNTPVMTPQRFEEVQLGISIEELERHCGEPYEVKKMSSGFKEHTYIHRQVVGSGVADYQVYVIYSCQGRVVGKNKRHNPLEIDIHYR